ncbi:MAG: nucleoside-triphosphatase [Bacteroidota bacterium]
MKHNHHIFVVTGGVQQGKTTFLSGLIHHLQKEQVSVTGFLSEGSFSDNQRSAFTLVNVENGERHDLASVLEKDGWIRFGRFFFNPGTLAVGERIIRKGLEQKADLVVLDEVGPFELNGGIWSDILIQLFNAQNIAQVWVVREQVLKEVMNRWHIPQENVTGIGPGSLEKFIQKIKAYVRNDEIGPAT